MRRTKKIIFTAWLVAGIVAFHHNAIAQTPESDKVTITLTEYSDYQCPACAYFHPIVDKLKEQFKDQLEVDLRHYPLNNHQFAALAARAAEAAGNQGKFDEMHDLLFENQDRWSNTSNPTSLFVNYARDIGLDLEEFRNDLNAAETQQVVMEQKKEGDKRGIRGTPTFFIEGEELQDLPRTYEDFEKIIRQHINRKQEQS